MAVIVSPKASHDRLLPLLIWVPVHSSLQKYFDSQPRQINPYALLSRTRQRGVRVVTDVERGMRWMRRRQETNDAETHTAKPRGSDAPTLAFKLVMMLRITRVTVAIKPGHREERGVSRKTIAQGRPDDPTSPVATTLVCFLPCTRGRGCGGHPAFPAPLFAQRLEVHASLGRHAPRERKAVFTSSLRPSFETPPVGRFSGRGRHR
jgi:hypothetical protein